MTSQLAQATPAGRPPIAREQRVALWRCLAFVGFLHVVGWGLLVLDGKPMFVHAFSNQEQHKYRVAANQTLSPGKHTLRFDFTYDGGGIGKGGGEGKDHRLFSSSPATVRKIVSISFGSDRRCPPPLRTVSWTSAERSPRMVRNATSSGTSRSASP